jgi:hypothetical protein
MKTTLLLALCLPLGLFAQKAADESPSDFYKRFDAAMASAAKFDEILPLLATEQREQIGQAPAEERDFLFGMMQDLRFKDVRILGEEKTADGATLSAIGKAPDGSEVKGQILLVIEDGEWRMNVEQWGSGFE